MYGNPVLEEMTHYPTMLKRIQLYSFLCSNIDEFVVTFQRQGCGKTDDGRAQNMILKSGRCIDLRDWSIRYCSFPEPLLGLFWLGCDFPHNQIANRQR